MPGTPPPALRSARPFGVCVLAGAYGVAAVLAAVVFILLARGDVVAPDVPADVAALVALSSAGVGWALSYSLWSQHKWAWYGAVGTAVLLIIVGLSALLVGASVTGLAAVALGLGTTSALRRPRVEAWFGVRGADVRAARAPA